MTHQVLLQVMVALAAVVLVLVKVRLVTVVYREQVQQDKVIMVPLVE